MVIATYHCKQQELYSIARTGWNSCADHLPGFATFRTNYTAAYIAERLQEIEEAELLPDQHGREELSRLLHIHLGNKAREVLPRWRSLKRYIVYAFPKDQHQIRFDAAGYAQYRRASRNDWPSVQRLLIDGNTFIEEHTTELLANGNMPASFITTFANTKDQFAAIYQQFLAASMNTPVQTQAKITANNMVHANLMCMLRDGQELFRNDEVLKKLFTFTHIAAIVGGPSSHAITEGITEENTPSLPAVVLVETTHALSPVE